LLSIHFKGWFECRLATDSDPSDETRGITGFTRAVAGEPDLDRVIRFQPQAGRPSRNPGPPVGVKVVDATIDGTTQIPALIDASVDLLSEPKYEGRNGLAFDDALEPVLPFHIHIAGQGVTLEREYRDVVTGNWKVSGPIKSNAKAMWLMEAALGHQKTDQYLAERRRGLGVAIKQAKTDIEKTALRARRVNLKRTQRIVEFFLPFGMHYRLELAGPWARISDTGNVLPCRIDTAPWICSFWMGAWDADALCGYVDGTLTAPLR
jgi:hypothetical protein